MAASDIIGAMTERPVVSSPGSQSPAYVLHGTIVTDGAVVSDGTVAVAGERIAYAGPRSGFVPAGFPAAEVLDVPDGGSILPGLIDLHCHGAAGGGFPNDDGPTCRAAVEFLHRSGTTTLLASLVTAAVGDMERQLGVLVPLVSEGLLAGIHAEGPFLSRARCGAQNPEWLRDPDPALLHRLLTAAGGTFRTMTYAPELPGAGNLMGLLAAHGVIPSLGHTDADAGTAAAALEDAARLLAAAPSGLFGAAARPTVTHLFNGMPPLHHRNPGPVAASLRCAAAGTAVVELIADGVHLDPETVRMVFDVAGAENIALVTDSMAATGLPDGEYRLGPSAVTVSGGVAQLAGSGALAGGTATLLEVLNRTIAAGVDPAAAVLAATAVPARVLGLDAGLGSLQAGMRADIVVVDRNYRASAVLRAGRILDAPLARI